MNEFRKPGHVCERRSCVCSSPKAVCGPRRNCGVEPGACTPSTATGPYRAPPGGHGAGVGWQRLQTESGHCYEKEELPRGHLQEVQTHGKQSKARPQPGSAPGPQHPSSGAAAGGSACRHVRQPLCPRQPPSSPPELYGGRAHVPRGLLPPDAGGHLVPPSGARHPSSDAETQGEGTLVSNSHRPWASDKRRHLSDPGFLEDAKGVEQIRLQGRCGDSPR